MGTSSARAFPSSMSKTQQLGDQILPHEYLSHLRPFCPSVLSFLCPLDILYTRANCLTCPTTKDPTKRTARSHSMAEALAAVRLSLHPPCKSRARNISCTCARHHPGLRSEAWKAEEDCLGTKRFRDPDRFWTAPVPGVPGAFRDRRNFEATNNRVPPREASTLRAKLAKVVPYGTENLGWSKRVFYCHLFPKRSTARPNFKRTSCGNRINSVQSETFWKLMPKTIIRIPS